MPLDPEYRLLADAASPGGTLRPGEREAASPSVDWERVEGLARWHRVEALLWRSLARGPVLAPAVWGRLEEAYLANAARNLYIQAELARVLGVLSAGSVPAMPLKGAALIEGVYPDAALRIMCDLDILVPRDDIVRAQAAVTSLGYRAEPVAPGRLGSEAGMAEHHQHLPPLVSPEGLIAVELHQHLVPPGDPARFDISGFWARARPSTTGPPHLVAAPEDLLVHVALNFARSRLWRSDGALGQVADVAWILDRQVVDWDALTDRAGADGVAASLFLAAFAAQELLGSAVPEPAMAALRPTTFGARQGRRFLERRVLRELSWPALSTSANRRSVAQILLERSRLRMRYDDGDEVGLGRLYGRRLTQAFRLLGHALARPRQWGAEVALNRWIRSLDRG